MVRRQQAADRAERPRMRSPRHPPLPREVERLFWIEIAKGVIPAEAAISVGSSQPVGQRWYMSVEPPHSPTGGHDPGVDLGGHVKASRGIQLGGTRSNDFRQSNQSRRRSLLAARPSLEDSIQVFSTSARTSFSRPGRQCLGEAPQLRYAANTEGARNSCPWALISTNCGVCGGRETKWIASTHGLSILLNSPARH